MRPDGRTASVPGALEHNHPPSGPSEHRRSHEAVVARPHDNRINTLHRDSQAPRKRSKASSRGRALAAPPRPVLISLRSRL